MTIELHITLYGMPLGVLSGASWRTADITFAAEALARWGVNSPVLSVAAPLELRPRKGRAERRRNVLSELLPEGAMRQHLARMAGVAPSDAPGLLARFGRDIAGAVQVFDPRAAWEPPPPALLPVDDDAVAALLDALALGNDPRLGKTSLAGVQPKILLARQDDRWYQAVGGAPTTHIIKPAPARGVAALAEEEYGHRLAVRLGLADHSVNMAKLGGRECLVIERYDRADGRRIHQEDFNQALGIAGDQKYQEYGGLARLTRVAEVLRRYAPHDLGRLAAHVTLAVAMGNLDLHAKNLSLLHPPDDATILAPAYDMAPLAHVPGIDGRLAMAVGREYALSAITAHHLEAEILTWGGDPAEARSTLERLAAIVDEEEALPGAESVRYRIALAVDRLLTDRPIGDAFLA